MSKKVKKLLVLILSFLTLFVVGTLGVACVDDKEDTSSDGSSGDIIDTQTPIAKTYNWNGLKDFNLKISYTEYAYDEVSVTDGEGLQYDVVVDDSAVKYGEKGEYTVKFTIDDQVKEQKVKIYDLPQISASETASFTYGQVINKSSVYGLFSFVTATDCFGTEIPVGVKESQSTASFYRQDGSVNYGDYTVTLGTVDASGQTAEKEITVTVERNESNEPTIEGGAMVADVVDDRQALNLSLKNREVIAISINGVVVDAEGLVVNGDGVITALDLTKIDLLGLGDDNVIRVITSGGYTEKSITLTDEKDAVMDVAGREIQTFILGDEPSIIQPKKVYPKQNFDIELSLISPSGEEIDTAQANFEADEIGVYVLTATAKRNGVKCGEVTVNYNVHQAFNSFRTEQERSGVKSYRNVYWTESCTATGTIRYEENKTLGDKTGTYLSFAYADSSYIAYKIPTSLSLAEIEDLKMQGVEEVFVEVYVDSLYKKSIRYLLVKMGYLDNDKLDEGETVGARITIEPLTWTKLSLNIDYIIENYTALKNGEMLLFNIYNGGDGLDVHENFRIYFSEMLFGLPLAEIEVAEDEYNSFTNKRYLNGAKVYRNINNATPALDGVELSWANGEIGGVEGTFAKVNISVYSSGGVQVAPARIGVKFPILKTLEEIQTLKNNGYTSLSVPMYIDCSQAKKVMGKIFTVGASATSVSWYDLPAQTWTTFTISIDEIIANYAGLANGTKILLPIVNSGDGGEKNQANFNIYYGSIKFVKMLDAGYNETNDLSDLKALGNAHGTGTNSGLYTATVTSAGGKTGNFFRVHLAYNSNGLGVEHVGISIKPDVTLAQLNALKNAGYTNLSADYYFEHKGDKEYSYKWVCTGGVYTYGNTEFAFNTLKEKKNLGEWYNFTVAIQDIIDNYEGLTNGTNYLMHIINSQWYGDNGDGNTRGHFYAYIGNMKFVKE